jgi:hypothetical protein
MKRGYEHDAETIMHSETTPQGLFEVQLQPRETGAEGASAGK